MDYTPINFLGAKQMTADARRTILSHKMTEDDVQRFLAHAGDITRYEGSNLKLLEFKKVLRLWLAAEKKKPAGQIITHSTMTYVPLRNGKPIRDLMIVEQPITRITALLPVRISSGKIIPLPAQAGVNVLPSNPWKVYIPPTPVPQPPTIEYGHPRLAELPPAVRNGMTSSLERLIDETIKYLLEQDDQRSANPSIIAGASTNYFREVQRIIAPRQIQRSKPTQQRSTFTPSAARTGWPVESSPLQRERIDAQHKANLEAGGKLAALLYHYLTIEAEPEGNCFEQGEFRYSVVSGGLRIERLSPRPSPFPIWIKSQIITSQDQAYKELGAIETEYNRHLQTVRAQ